MKNEKTSFFFFYSEREGGTDRATTVKHETVKHERRTPALLSDELINTNTIFFHTIVKI